MTEASAQRMIVSVCGHCGGPHESRSLTIDAFTGKTSGKCWRCKTRTAGKMTDMAELPEGWPDS